MPSALSPEEQKFITGVQANLWTEYIPTLAQAQYMVLPRMAALAEKRSGVLLKRRIIRILETYGSSWMDLSAEGMELRDAYLGCECEHRFQTETGKLDVTASTIDDAPVYYTLDGTEPTTTSSRYENGLTIDAACVLRMMAVASGRQLAALRVTATAFKASLRRNLSPLCLQPINKPYSEFKGATTLVDGMTGDPTSKTGRWIAFYKNDMEAVIDLKEATEISSMTLRTFVERATGRLIQRHYRSRTTTRLSRKSGWRLIRLWKSGCQLIYTHTLTFDR